MKKERFKAKAFGMVIIFAVLLLGGIMYSCFLKGSDNSFRIIYSDILNLTDLPSMWTEPELYRSKLPKIYSKTQLGDPIPFTRIVYGKGLTVKSMGHGFEYSATEEHAFALRIESYLDLYFYADFRDKGDAEDFYQDILDYGMIEDPYGARFVTERKLQSGVTKVPSEEFADYQRTICVTAPKELIKGWYTVSFEI